MSTCRGTTPPPPQRSEVETSLTLGIATDLNVLEIAYAQLASLPGHRARCPLAVDVALSLASPKRRRTLGHVVELQRTNP
jgi:hypothetical protein